MCRCILPTLAFILVPAFAYGEVVIAYDLTGKNGDEFFAADTHSAPHINGLALVRGDGLTATMAANSFAASGWDDNSIRDYFSFGFFVAPGYQATLTDLLIATRSSSTGPGEMFLYYNYTGGTDIVRADFEQSGTTTVNSDVDLGHLTVTGRGLFEIYRSPFAGSASGGAVSPIGTFRILNYTDPITSAASPITLLGTVSRVSPYGDFDYDGAVDGHDYAVWQGSFGSRLQLAADGNEDGVVDGADYLVWQKNLGASQPPPPSSGASAAAPEPASFSLLALGALSLGAIRRQLARKLVAFDH